MSMKVIDLQRDELVPLNAICLQRLGRRMSPACLWRWRLKGCNGVKLEAVKVGASWFTTHAAFAAFIEGQTAAAMPVDSGSSEVTERSEELKARLRKAGLLRD